MNNNNNDTPHRFYERLSAVEVEVKNLKDDFNEFANNHFESFKKDIRTDIKFLAKKVNGRPTWLLMSLISSLLSLSVGLIVFLLTRG